jgi:hypothetical protein
MSTRCNIHFRDGLKPANGKRKKLPVIAANIYRHSDGYPNDGGVLDDMKDFFAAVKEQCGGDTRFNDPYYLSAKFVVFQANIDRECKIKYGNGQPVGELNFLGVGIVNEDASDGEYIYEVWCGNDKEPEITYKKV